MIEQLFLVELGQVGQELLGIVEVVVDIAIDQIDAVSSFGGPAGRGALFANVDLVEFVGCLSHCCPPSPNPFPHKEGRGE